MATYSYTTAGTYTLSIPLNATNITYEIIGARGGTGGTGYGHPGGNSPWPGGTGGYGQRITGSLKTAVNGKTLTIIVGSTGNIGYTYSPGTGGGGFRTGGTGGYNYSSSDGGGFYGAAGGGGGGSSVITISDGPSLHVLTAGGGGGGGGGQWFEFGGSKNGQTSNVLNTLANPLVVGSANDTSRNGYNGSDSGASFNGAGGGGGAGFIGGQGGTAYQSGNSIAGAGGAGGQGYYSTSYVDSYTVNTTHTTSARVVISYDLAIPPTIDSFTSTVTQLPLGQSASLSWQASSASGPITSITLNGVAVSNNSGQVVSPTTTTTYTLSVSNAYYTVTSSITITVLPPPVVSISLNPTQITKGSNTSTLTWSATGDNLTSITISNIGNVASSGSITVNPASTTTYTISATNGGGTVTASATLTVLPPPPPTIFFGADKTVISPGQSVILNWSTFGFVDQVRLNNNIVANPSSTTVSPAATTNYTLTATGEGGTTTETITVTVLASQSPGGVYSRPSNGSNIQVSIPANAANVRVTAVGAKGGNGGNDSTPGGTGGNGRGAVFSLSDFTPRTLTLNIGASGTNGFGCVSSSGSGAGGGGVSSGGAGGNTGPQGCSGGGGGGGGATGVYDSVANSWIIVAGGGGGAGGGSHPDSFLRGGDGGFGTSFSTGNLSNISNGANGTSQGFDGGGGGGGGGGAPGGTGGREGADDRAGRYPSGGGNGGASAYNSNYASLVGSEFTYNGSGYVDISYTLVYPTVSSFTATPSAIRRGQTTRLSWSTSNATSATINNGVGSVPVNGFIDVSPLTTTVYTLSLTGLGNTTGSGQVIVTVYQPPSITFNIYRNPIAVGESTTIAWETFGDADTITWNSGGIVNGNLSSSATISPTDSTTYSATVSGLGGTYTGSVRLVVNQRPTASLVTPTSLVYNQQAILSYESAFSNISLTLTPTYTYGRGIGAIVGTPVSLPIPNSSENGVGITTVTGTVTTQIPYNTTGPFSVTYTLTAVGNGGSRETIVDIPIIVDERPENINIPETQEAFKLQDPVISPNYDVTSNLLELDGVDIPVEIKSNKPIKVDLNRQDNWQDIRQL